MASIITSIKDIVTSMLELTVSVCHTTFDAIFGLLRAIASSFIGTLRVALRAVGNTFEAAGGLWKFLASNIIVLAVIAGGTYGYLQYQSRQRRPVKFGNSKLS
ncbi:hypothetical protein PENANT_c023G03396 [Penicillium antarcticum]|uniref:Uncharacterized protein n=1 Tax=Penicillium antarcticum TaxID=416450 RepID=A0A1V6PYQ9_9EURO|nr:uncharacterized protein N7508_006113 [Penicillium antarcticum]KAJ5301250.1 hypothetical protein N7508_006113 [Penicillium antarcticum]OQD82158.1 hypothetical protein PENANT_c023G03396 [Penicillium antarcticum]